MVRPLIDDKSDAGHTDSTLPSSPAKSQRPVSPSPAPAGPPQIDQRKVYELRQTIDVDKLLKGTGEELSDVSIKVLKFSDTVESWVIIETSGNSSPSLLVSYSLQVFVLIPELSFG